MSIIINLLKFLRMRRGLAAFNCRVPSDKQPRKGSCLMELVTLDAGVMGTISDLLYPSHRLQSIISWCQQSAVILEGARLRPCRVPSDNSRGRLWLTFTRRHQESLGLVFGIFKILAKIVKLSKTRRPVSLQVIFDGQGTKTVEIFQRPNMVSEGSM